MARPRGKGKIGWQGPSPPGAAHGVGGPRASFPEGTLLPQVLPCSPPLAASTAPSHWGHRAPPAQSQALHARPRHGGAAPCTGAAATPPLAPAPLQMLHWSAGAALRAPRGTASQTHRRGTPRPCSRRRRCPCPTFPSAHAAPRSSPSRAPSPC
eukprot:scaffold13708_cov116-Isochrysis_galbana.AAC.11